MSAHSAWCGSIGPGKWVTRTGPGRWGKACGSVGCGEGGTPPGVLSALGSTWSPAIKMTVEQSRPMCVWFCVWQSVVMTSLSESSGAHRPRGGTGWRRRCASCWAQWQEQAVRSDRWGAPGWSSSRGGCRMGKEQRTSPEWWEWCLKNGEGGRRRREKDGNDR